MGMCLRVYQCWMKMRACLGVGVGVSGGNNVCLIKQELFCGLPDRWTLAVPKPSRRRPPPRSYKRRLSASLASGRGRNSEQEGTRKSAEQAVALLVAVK